MMTERRTQGAQEQIAGLAINALLSLMRGKLKFLALITIVFVAGLIYADGFSGTAITVGIVAVLIVGLFASLVWFWTAILSSFNSQKKP